MTNFITPIALSETMADHFDNTGLTDLLHTCYWSLFSQGWFSCWGITMSMSTASQCSDISCIRTEYMPVADFILNPVDVSWKAINASHQGHHKVKLITRSRSQQLLSKGDTYYSLNMIATIRWQEARTHIHGRFYIDYMEKLYFPSWTPYPTNGTCFWLN